MSILCKYQRELDLFVYKKLNKKEYEKLYDFYLNLIKWWRINYLKLSPKKRKEINNKIKEISYCLFINTDDNPKIKKWRIDYVKQILRMSRNRGCIDLDSFVSNSENQKGGKKNE